MWSTHVSTHRGGRNGSRANSKMASQQLSSGPHLSLRVGQSWLQPTGLDFSCGHVLQSLQVCENPPVQGLQCHVIKRQTNGKPYAQGVSPKPPETLSGQGHPEPRQIGPLKGKFHADRHQRWTKPAYWGDPPITLCEVVHPQKATCSNDQK